MKSNEGKHNSNLEAARDRLTRGQSYKDLSTIVIVPCVAGIPARVVQSWLALQNPMNQRVIRMFVENTEVGEAYSNAIKDILANPVLSKFRYVLTMETDNIPPPDGLLNLYEGIQQYDAVGGLYWTKGEGGQPMIYGDPYNPPLNFTPQLPRPDTLQRCNGLGMGFTLFRLKMFKDPALRQPWFKTLQSRNACYTQDLYFFEDACKQGYKFACDTRIKVGHYDHTTDTIW